MSRRSASEALERDSNSHPSSHAHGRSIPPVVLLADPVAHPPPSPESSSPHNKAIGPQEAANQTRALFSQIASPLPRPRVPGSDADSRYGPPESRLAATDGSRPR